MGHSDLNVSRIDEDLSKVSDFRKDNVEVDDAIVSDNTEVSNKIIAPVTHNVKNISRHERHLCENYSDSSFLRTKKTFLNDPESEDIYAKVQFNTFSRHNSAPKTPKRSNFEKIKLAFEEKSKKGEGMSGSPSVVPSGKSPGLLRLMQQNERRLSEKLKSKKEKNSLRKLKRSEKEAKFEKEKEFRDLQIEDSTQIEDQKVVKKDR